MGGQGTFTDGTSWSWGGGVCLIKSDVLCEHQRGAYWLLITPQGSLCGPFEPDSDLCQNIINLLFYLTASASPHLHSENNH